MLAPAALKLHGIEKVVMGPKEGLGLVNGTAVSGSSISRPLPVLHLSNILLRRVSLSKFSFYGNLCPARCPFPGFTFARSHCDDRRSHDRPRRLLPSVGPFYFPLLSTRDVHLYTSPTRSFIHDVTRPHPGQIQVARNIRNSLQGSKFAVFSEEEVGVKEDEGILRQDRYPLRTAAQVSFHKMLWVPLD